MHLRRKCLPAPRGIDRPLLPSQIASRFFSIFFGFFSVLVAEF